ncbi:MAG: AAA family ATPase [Chloroflexi bacterium]|nr:AAA family ATPase [Chloroflexota bacterium]
MTRGQATGRTLPPETTAIRESFLQAAQFVGRELEVEQLTNRIKQAMDGRGGGILVGGESGAGKSQLFDELVPITLTQRMVLLRGHCGSSLLKCMASKSR